MQAVINMILLYNLSADALSFTSFVFFAFSSSLLIKQMTARDKLAIKIVIAFFHNANNSILRKQHISADVKKHADSYRKFIVRLTNVKYFSKGKKFLNK